MNDFVDGTIYTPDMISCSRGDIHGDVPVPADDWGGEGVGPPRGQIQTEVWQTRTRGTFLIHPVS